MVEESKKMISLFWHVRPPETPLCWQNTGKVTPRLYSRSISHGNKEHIWSISVAALYSERKVTQKQVLHSQKVCMLRLHRTSAFENRHGCIPIGVCSTGVCSLRQ